MYESPGSLQDVCLDYISDNIEALCEVQMGVEDEQSSMVFRTEEVYFHPSLSDQLLQSLSEKQKLNDEVMTLFQSSVTALKRVRIRDAPITTAGMQVLQNHKITELEVVGMQTPTIVNDLVNCLSDWTLNNLRVLNVANGSFIVPTAKFCDVVSLSKLRNLQSLNVSNTEFNQHGLEVVTQDLPLLESLDISRTPVSDLSPLRKCKERLKSLSLFNLSSSHSEDFVSVLCELGQLRHLDISDDFFTQPLVTMQPTKLNVRELLERVDVLPHLTSLDISGKDGITEQLIGNFLDTHPHLGFLGLALTEMSYLPIFTSTESACYRPNIITTGEAMEDQLLEALRRYTARAVYVQKTLYNLFSLTQSLLESRTDMIKLILPAMKHHPNDLGVQMAATACLYNLSKSELGQKIHPKWLGKIVHLTLDGMENFPKHQQLQKNALLTLCSDRILQDVSFDHFRCAKLVMDCLCNFDEASMNRMSVAICSILAAKIPTEQTSKLGANAEYMQKLLAIVKEKKEQQVADVTMRFTLSALWNLTDESPSTCEMFLSEGGLQLFLDVLMAYKDQSDEVRTQVETKVLGLINNLAEVKTLRQELMREDVIAAMRDSLQSKHIDVSYFAAGIISHIITDGASMWSVENITRQEILDELGNAVLQWEQPQGEMVAYRSFSPFFPLLDHFDAPQIQLWAVWAIQHVCSKNGNRYCPMLENEGGSIRLQKLLVNQSTDKRVSQIAESILKTVAEQLQSHKDTKMNSVSSP